MKICECENPVILLDIDSSGQKVRLCRNCRGHVVVSETISNAAFVKETEHENTPTEIRE